MTRFAGVCFAILFTLLAAESGRAYGVEASDLTDDEKARIKADQELRRKLSEAAGKVAEQQKKWETGRTASDSAGLKESEENEEARKAAEKARKKREKELAEAKKKTEEGRKGGEEADERSARAATPSSDDPRYRVNYAGHAMPASSSEGGWFEIGGVTRSSRYGASNSGASVRESGGGGTSIGVRATVIRLGDPDE